VGDPRDSTRRAHPTGPELRRDLGFETVPNQTTLSWNWHDRFTTALRKTTREGDETHPAHTQPSKRVGPSEPPATLDHPETEQASPFDDQTILDRAAASTNRVGRPDSPAFSPDRGEGCEVHEHAFRQRCGTNSRVGVGLSVRKQCRGQEHEKHEVREE
jgi:hypothetical protein